MPTKQGPKELKSVHPLGKSPVITDGDVTLAESGAIVEYLIAKYGKGRAQPPESGWVDNLYCEQSFATAFEVVLKENCQIRITPKAH